MSDANKATVARYVEDVINRYDMTTIDEIFHSGCVNHTVAGDMHGPDGMRTFLNRLRSNMPDLRATVEDLVAENDRVVARLTLRGTYTGELNGVACKGQPVTFAEIQIYRFADQKIAERWYVADRLGLWQQLGVIHSVAPRKTEP